ncbi:MAG: Uma2 family endonuclease [bacterium]|nr:Uma2 family endonuclease [bacterium]
MSSVSVVPPGAAVEYPEGPRVPEGDLQTRRRMELVSALRDWLAGRPGGESAWVCTDINIYFEEGDPRVVVAPDVAVAFGVDVEAVENRSTYKVWEAGAVPVFALEIASHTTFKRDLRAKPAALGVEEYWRLDPTGGDYFRPPLQGDARRSGRWRSIEVSEEGDGGLRGRSEALGLDLCWQPPKLRLFDVATGRWLRDYDDQNLARVEAEGRALDAEGRALDAEARAEQAESARRALEAELDAMRRLRPQ